MADIFEAVQVGVAFYTLPDDYCQEAKKKIKVVMAGGDFAVMRKPARPCCGYAYMRQGWYNWKVKTAQ